MYHWHIFILSFFSMAVVTLIDSISRDIREKELAVQKEKEHSSHLLWTIKAMLLSINWVFVPISLFSGFDLPTLSV